MVSRASVADEVLGGNLRARSTMGTVSSDRLGVLDKEWRLPQADVEPSQDYRIELCSGSLRSRPEIPSCSGEHPSEIQGS